MGKKRRGNKKYSNVQSLDIDEFVEQEESIVIPSSKNLDQTNYDEILGDTIPPFYLYMIDFNSNLTLEGAKKLLNMIQYVSIDLEPSTCVCFAIEFNSKEELIKAHKLDNYIVFGKPIKMSFMSYNKLQEIRSAKFQDRFQDRALLMNFRSSNNQSDSSFSHQITNNDDSMINMSFRTNSENNNNDTSSNFRRDSNLESSNQANSQFVLFDRSSSNLNDSLSSPSQQQLQQNNDNNNNNNIEALKNFRENAYNSSNNSYNVNIRSNNILREENVENNTTSNSNKSINSGIPSINFRNSPNQLGSENEEKLNLFNRNVDRINEKNNNNGAYVPKFNRNYLNANNANNTNDNANDGLKRMENFRAIR